MVELQPHQYNPGRTTLLGWDGPESQWRGEAFGEMARGRAEALQSVYRSGAAEIELEVLDEWGIDYVYIGPTGGSGNARSRSDRRSVSLRQWIWFFGWRRAHLSPVSASIRTSRALARSVCEQDMTRMPPGPAGTNIEMSSSCKPVWALDGGTKGSQAWFTVERALYLFAFIAGIILRFGALAQSRLIRSEAWNAWAAWQTATDLPGFLPN